MTPISFGALHNRNVGYYAYHHAGHHERQRGEAYQRIGNHVDEIVYHRDDKRKIVSVGYVVALRRGYEFAVYHDILVGVPAVEIGDDGVLMLEIDRIDGQR